MSHSSGKSTKAKKPTSASTPNRDTPAMRQYTRFKERFPGCLLLFRMGDFYELFDEDAVTASNALGLTLTERTSGIPMAGVPYHACESYLRRLIEQGFRVAVCDQIQDPKHAKGVVERAVTRVLTPGTLVDQGLLDDGAPTTLGCVAFGGDGTDPFAPAALATIDLSTGAFRVVPAFVNELADAVEREGVKELLFAENADGATPERTSRLIAATGVTPTARPAWQFRADESREAISELFRVSSLAGFGLDDTDTVTIAAAGAIVRYVRETQALSDSSALDVSGQTEEVEALKRKTLRHIRPPVLVRASESLVLDAPSLRALEVEKTLRTRSSEGSLLGVFLHADRTRAPRTAMGKRSLRAWLCAPLRSREQINARLGAVELMVAESELLRSLGTCLDGVADVGRIAARVGLRRASPRDLVALAESLDRLNKLITAVGPYRPLRTWAEKLGTVQGVLVDLGETLRASCVESPPATLREGGLVRDGVDPELDDARDAERTAADWLVRYQAKLTEEHEIPSMKVGYNRVFGYYIELPTAQAQRAPSEFTRKQTLKNAERFITPELKEFEDSVLTAKDRAIARELAIFHSLCDAVAEQSDAIQLYSDTVAELDALWCFASTARQAGWVRPELTDERSLVIDQGRHPVLERSLGSDLVPNDTSLGSDEHPQTLALITGPNMAGKSTYIRQVALIALLAHAGSFVPAKHARIPTLDRIFTRIGADDALHEGQSTFMVEMVETANILNNATSQSLVVLDEVGRGTSTLDGLSLAWAIAEQLARTHSSQEHVATPLSLFATHYHEITSLEDEHPQRIRNLAVQTREYASSDGPRVVFTHTISPGRASQSFGVHVAQLAGLPASVVSRADQLLGTLSVERDSSAIGIRTASKAAAPESQLGLFAPEVKPHPVIEELKGVNIDRLTPLDAFDLLRKYAEQIRNHSGAL